MNLFGILRGELFHYSVSINSYDLENTWIIFWVAVVVASAAFACTVEAAIVPLGCFLGTYLQLQGQGGLVLGQLRWQSGSACTG